MKNIIKAFVFLFCLANVSCGIDEALMQEYLNEGIWRGVIKTQDQEIPFNFEVIREDSVTYDLFIINGKDRFNIKGLAMQGDSVFIPINLYDAGIKAKLTGNKLIGVYKKNYDENSTLPFEAVHNQSFRFPSKGTTQNNLQGKWEVTFKDQDEIVNAVGIFTQEGPKVEGTFITSLGDFRYLEGVVEKDILWLSAFDGANAFLFKADIKNPNELDGHFWSGAYDYQSWSAVKNEEAQVETFLIEELLKDADKPFNFNLTDLNGKKTSLLDPKYKDKIKVIHLFGTWCPNSIDEVHFLAEWHKNNKNQEVVVIGLAFEQLDDFTYAKNRVNNMASRLNAQYDFVVAGTADKAAAAEKFPMLQSIKMYPTTLVLDKNNKVRLIKAGFNGPASGIYHEEFIREFNDMIDQLLIEQEQGTSHLVLGK